MVIGCLSGYGRSHQSGFAKPSTLMREFALPTSISLFLARSFLVRGGGLRIGIRAVRADELVIRASSCGLAKIAIKALGGFGGGVVQQLLDHRPITQIVTHK